MEFKSYTAFVYLILVTFLHKGLSKECYNCDWDTRQILPSSNKYCESGPFNSTNVATERCDEGECFVVKDYTPDGVYVTRQCGPKGLCDTIKEYMDRLGQTYSCSSCDSDLCNSGHLLEIQTLAVLLLAAFLSHRLS